MKLIYSFTIAVFFLLPVFASAQVVINEIAWMGTENSANDEWIELKNIGEDSVSLDGWVLEAQDGSPKIELSGNVPAGGFYLLERSDDNSAPGVLADRIYTGALSNSGELLILKDKNGQEVDRVNGLNNWELVGGDKDLKYTAQKINGKWESSKATAKKENVLFWGEQNSNTEKENSENTNKAKKDSKNNTQKTENQKEKSSIKADAGENIVAGVGQNIFFDGSKSLGDDVLFTWNMGNGDIRSGESFLYSYDFPGKYLVSLQLTKTGERSISQVEVVVYPTELYISEFFYDENGRSWIELYNASGDFVDLSFWKIKREDEVFTLPENTFIADNSYLVFSSDVLGDEFLAKEGELSFLYPNFQSVDRVEYLFGKEGFSASRKNKDEFVWTKNKTPGQANVVVFSGVSALEDEDKAKINSKRGVSKNLIKENWASFVFVSGEKSFLVAPAYAKVVGEAQKYEKENFSSLSDKVGARAYGAFSLNFLSILISFFAFLFVFWLGRKFSK